MPAERSTRPRPSSPQPLASRERPRPVGSPLRSTLARIAGPRLAAILLAGAAVSAPTPAAAWDPSTTHQALLESAITRSAMHLRWMDGSGLERGVFSPIRLDPARLSPAQLRLLRRAIAGAHADSGALPLGGPGACPSASAPMETQLFCVEGDLWEHSAIGWMRLGMLAEVTPSARHIHHFLDRAQLDADRWVDRELPASLLRARQARSNGEPRAGIATRTNFAGAAPSALTWLEDPDDPLAPQQTFAHLEAASQASSEAERQHELALALLGVGALLHVVQDLSVPAHARGDASAFFAPLSPSAGDRGLPLQEFVRFEYGRGELPGVALDMPSEAPSGEPLAATLIGHLLGDPDRGYEGLAVLAGRRYLSESSVPSPRYLEPTLTPSEAAAALLAPDRADDPDASGVELDPVEIDGAVLSPWPAERGYLLSPTGRALAAFDTDLEGRIRLYLDETCYRDAAAFLLPAASDATRSILDLLWPAWPATRRTGDALVLTTPTDWAGANLMVQIEAPNGERRPLAEHPLNVGGETTIALGLEQLSAEERAILVLRAERPGGVPVILEQRLDSLVEGEAVSEPGPSSRPEGEATAEPGDAAAEPAAAEPAAAEPAAAEPAAAEPAAAESAPESGEPESGEPGGFGIDVQPFER
jgi:hypothetical protein